MKNDITEAQTDLRDKLEKFRLNLNHLAARRGAYPFSALLLKHFWRVLSFWF